MSVLLWMPVAIYVPRLAIELIYYYVQPTLKIDKNIRTAIILEFLMWDLS